MSPNLLIHDVWERTCSVQSLTSHMWDTCSLQWHYMCYTLALAPQYPSNCPLLLCKHLSLFAVGRAGSIEPPASHHNGIPQNCTALRSMAHHHSLHTFHISCFQSVLKLCFLQCILAVPHVAQISKQVLPICTL